MSTVLVQRLVIFLAAGYNLDFCYIWENAMFPKGTILDILAVLPSRVKEQQCGQLLWEISSPMALQHLYVGSFTKRSREHTAASWRLAQPAGMISASERPGGPAAFPKGFFPATGCWCRAGKPQHRRQNSRETETGLRKAAAAGGLPSIALRERKR